MKVSVRLFMLFLWPLVSLAGCRTGGPAEATGKSTEPATRRIEAASQGNVASVAPAPEPASRGPGPAVQEPESDAEKARVTPESAGPATGQSQLTERQPEPAAPPVEPPVQRVKRPTESVPEGGCVTRECHPGIKANPVTHGPVGADACEACHEEDDAANHTFKFSEEEEELCASCHDLELDQKCVHQPVADGQCVQCHDPHGEQDQFMLRGGGGAETCTECHDDFTEGMPIVHSPVAAGACAACHRAHGSDNPKLLARPGRELCLECHLTLKKRLDTVRVVHGPAAVGCDACHLPHAGQRKMMLREEGSQLCLDCHSEIEDRLDTATVKHDAVTSGDSCRNCHDPHGSDFAAMLPSDMVDVCLSCHDREIELADGSCLTDMKALLDDGVSLHGPIAQHDCVACHQIHGGSNFRLLIEEYPPEFYVPFREETYALCFGCHDRELVLAERTDRLTDFRNGDHNLHYLHVNNKVKGRTCRACHETHASHNAKQIRESVPFGVGGWQLPINYEKTETGGRCSPGCHRPCGYDRVNPVGNLPAKTRAAWSDMTVALEPRNRGERRGSQQ